MKPIRSLLFLRAVPTALALAAAGLPALQAQQAASAPADEVVRLSEFRVDSSQDRGYLASNAISGTRLNTPVRDLPMHLEVITRDFIEDIGAVDFKEALEYSAGVVQDSVQASNNFLFSPSGTGQSGANTLRPDSTALNIRGYNTRFVLRNGFRVDSVTDIINVGRQELVRGPQALLYGVSALGGVVNVLPRYPRTSNYTQVRVGYGSDDFQRAELYQTGPISQNGMRYLTYGIGVLYNNQSDASDFNDRQRIAVTPTVDWRVFDKTNVFIDVEWAKFKTTGNGFQDFPDASVGNVRNELGLLRASNLDLFGDTMTVARNTFGKDRFFRWSGSDTYVKEDYLSATIQVEQKLLDDRLTLVAAANLNKTDRKSRSIDSQGVQLQNSATQPTALGQWVDTGSNPLNLTQRTWRSLNWQWAMPTVDKEIQQARVEANYTFNLFGNPQSILIGRQEQTLKQDSQSTAQVTSNLAGGTNRSYKAYNDLSYITYQGEAVRPFRDNTFWEWATGHYAVYQGRFWNERINAIAGYRWDRYMVRSLDWTYIKADTTQPDSAVSNWVRPANYDASANSAPGAVPVVEGYRFGGKVQREESPNYGVNVRITDNINAFVMSGRGVFPNTGQRDGAGNPFQAEKTKGSDAGLKADLWKSDRGLPKVSLQLGAYKIERENAIYNVFWAPQPRSNNRARATANYPAGGQIVFGTGPNAYGVYSSGFDDFETSRPVTYLLPIQYVAAADLTHPRVTGAPQLNNFILVDYASLGTAANDPLRRAMNAAATDSGNLTALQTAQTGSGATALRANNAYARNRNSDVAYNDASEGVDLSVIFNLTRSYSATLTYSYIQQEVTGGFRVVDQPSSTEYDSWWNYMGIPLETRQANLDESSYDFSGSAAGVRTIDVPEQQVSMWNKYTFESGRLKGFDVGLGFTWRNERQSQITLDNGVRNTGLTPENRRFKPPYPADIKANLALGYRTKLGGRDWRFQLNVNNLFDDQKDEAFGQTDLWINPATGATVASTTAGAQKITVPERAVIYFAPISFRLTATVAF